MNPSPSASNRWNALRAASMSATGISAPSRCLTTVRTRLSAELVTERGGHPGELLPVVGGGGAARDPGEQFLVADGVGVGAGLQALQDGGAVAARAEQFVEDTGGLGALWG